MAVLLLVEGNDDFHAISKLIECHQLGTVQSARVGGLGSCDYVVKEKGGYPRLRDDLPVELKSGGFSVFGIVVDADLDPGARWTSVRDRLDVLGESSTTAFESLPGSLSPMGTFIEAVDGKRVGIWIWPDNIATGTLESFAATMVPVGDPHWPVALDAVRNLQDPRFSARDRHVAEIHTWLAWQQNPGQQIGAAIRSNTLHSNGAAAERFVSWLKTLKDLDT